MMQIDKTNYLLKILTSRGKSFRDGVAAELKSVEDWSAPGADYNIVAILDRFEIKPGIDMPWGVRVTP